MTLPDACWESLICGSRVHDHICGMNCGPNVFCLSFYSLSHYCNCTLPSLIILTINTAWETAQNDPKIIALQSDKILSGFLEKDQASDALRMRPISFIIEQLIYIITLTSANTRLVCHTGELKAHTVYDSLKGLTAEID